MSNPSSPGGPPPSEPQNRRRWRFRRFWKSSLHRVLRIAQRVVPDFGRCRWWLGRKSFWDWLDLLAKLAIPVVVAVVGSLLALHQTQLADLQHQRDQQSAQNQLEAAILQTYISSMQDLLLNHDLKGSRPGDEVRQAATEQTVVALRRLNDARRNRVVLQFLQDARLVGGQDPVINLSGADLSDDDLTDAPLAGIDLIGATLTGAHLRNANLSGANLSAANLSDADLRGAILTDAFLSEAILTNADLTGTHLSNAALTNGTLTSAHMSGAILTGADMRGTLLSGAYLTGADMDGAFLSGATLTGGADLAPADLSGADLNGADLSSGNGSSSAIITQSQLDEVQSCTNADLGYHSRLVCHHKPKITLTYWYTESGPETSVIFRRINQFERLYPLIKIKRAYKQFLQTRAALPTAVQGGEGPDVLRSDIGWVTLFASKGYLLNIDSYVTQRELADYQQLNPPGGSRLSPLAYDEYNGHLYGLPQVTDCLALLYNKAELAKAGINPNSPPATMAALERDAEQVTHSNAAGYGFETSGTSYFALPFLYAFGGGMFDRHNNIAVDSAGSIKGLQFLRNLEDNTGQAGPLTVDFSNGLNNMVNDFMDDKTAMIFDGPWDVSKILSGSGFKSNPGNLGIAPIPMCASGPTCPARQAVSPVGGQSYVISAGTAHPYEAYKFISFMSSKDSQVAIAKANHTLPTLSSAYSKVSSDRFISEFHYIWEREAVARPAIPQGGYLFDAFDRSIWAVLVGVQDPQDALKAVFDSWKQIGVGG